MLSPAQIMQRLEDIDGELARIQNDYEQVAEDWTRSKRERELAYARAYMGAVRTYKNVTDRKEAATLESENVGLEDEAKYVALKGVVEVLTTRATIGQSLLKAHGRIG